MVLRPAAALYLILPLIVAGCGAPERGTTLIIGHGGLGDDGPYPMNSAPALLGGLALGVDGVEMDVQLSADGVLLAYHGEHLDAYTPCTGLINAHDRSALQHCPLMPGAEASFPLVRLDSLLPEAIAAHPNARFILDIKLFAAGDWWTYLERFSDALTALHALPGVAGHLVVECQVPDLLRLMQRKAPEVSCFLYITDYERGLAAAQLHGFDGITIEHGLITAEEVDHARSAGLKVALFGVGGWWGHRNALRMDPDILQSDAPELFKRSGE